MVLRLFQTLRLFFATDTEGAGRESKFVKIQLRPSSLTTEGEKLGWKTSTPLNHSPPRLAEGALLQEKSLACKRAEKKITDILHNK